MATPIICNCGHHVAVHRPGAARGCARADCPCALGRDEVYEDAIERLEATVARLRGSREDS